MAGQNRFYCLLMVGLAFALSANGEEQNAAGTYVVHMAKWRMPASFANHEQWYTSVAQLFSAEVLYHYNEVFHGFATRLRPDQAEALRGERGVLGIYSEQIYELHTTRTPEFLGLSSNDGLWPQSGYGEDVVVGVLDTGIWPESESFHDDGLGPPPAKWKGLCEGGSDFQCNSKVVGARFYRKGADAVGGNNSSSSARDYEGHGSHTSSTAAGTFVKNASFLGYASGSARGMATRARIAVYKVCWDNGCPGSDTLAAMDQAVMDGVDVLSLSFGTLEEPYYENPIAIGAFGAMERGVFVSCSAGNNGQSLRPTTNAAPWIATIGASTLDRDFPAYAVLGNGERYYGVSLYAGNKLLSGLLEFVYAGNVSLAGVQGANLCLSGTLDPKRVAGKILFCERGGNGPVGKGAVVKDAGGVGMIVANTAGYGEEVLAEPHLLPATAVGEKEGSAIKAYLFSVASPTATIDFKGTALGVKPAPVMAAFSSRGPNPITPDILKPDMTAPGVNILAAWSGAASPTGLQTDNRRVPFNIISGTSMSCPHVSGIAALLKGAHPDWSPGAIKSALMTTAYTMDNAGNAITDMATGKPATPFVYGAGHVDPEKALDPGLIYDVGQIEYLNFLCSLNYNETQIKIFAKQNYSCGSNRGSPADLNYPSMVVIFRSSVVKVSRTVTNVGAAGSSYKVSVSAPSGVEAVVEPATLGFAEVGEKKTYSVTFTTRSVSSADTAFGSLTWTDGTHTVRSPVVFARPGGAQ